MDYISYSQYTSYTRCPRSWYLGKVKRAEEKQTWYIPIGSAVHTAIEKHLNEEPVFIDQIFYDLVSKQMKIEPDTSKWLHGGSEQEPIVEGLALKRVQECFDNALEFLDEIEVWAIEYDATGSLPGLEIPLKGFVDIIGEHDKHGPVIVDWKTGSQKPKDNFQLETYAARLRSDNDERFQDASWNKGLWVMLSPNASKARPVDLSTVSPKDVGAKYQAVYEQMQQKLYKTNAGYNCRFCFNQDNCKLNAGINQRTLYYDRADEDGYPF